MRVVVTGRDGQLARSLAERAAGSAEIVLLGRPDLDLRQPETIAAAMQRARPDIVVNAAAYTAVDRAEAEPDLALAVNGTGAGAVATAAAAEGVPVIQISTDYVFDGTLPRPYREEDATAPATAYGRSKLLGEELVAAATRDHVILRTSWVYSPFGTNFVKTMLRLGFSREAVSVVADQHGCPTNALDLADGVLAMCRNLLAHPSDERLRGVLHLAGAGEATWALLAEESFRVARRLGAPAARVEPIASAAYPTPARRPMNSRLDCAKIAGAHGVVLPDWRASLPACVTRLLAEGRS